MSASVCATECVHVCVCECVCMCDVCVCVCVCVYVCVRERACVHLSVAARARPRMCCGVLCFIIPASISAKLKVCIQLGIDFEATQAARNSVSCVKYDYRHRA